MPGGTRVNVAVKSRRGNVALFSHDIAGGNGRRQAAWRHLRAAVSCAPSAGVVKAKPTRHGITAAWQLAALAASSLCYPRMSLTPATAMRSFGGVLAAAVYHCLRMNEAALAHMARRKAGVAYQKKTPCRQRFF